MARRQAHQTQFPGTQGDLRDQRTRALLAKANTLAPTRASAAREEAILINRPLALALARQYSGRGIDDDDLVGHSIRAAIPTLTQRLQRHPSSRELATYLGIPVETIEEAKLAEGMYFGRSLDVPVPQSTVMLGDTLPDPSDGFAPVEAALTIGPALAQLAPRDKPRASYRVSRTGAGIKKSKTIAEGLK